MPHTADAEDIWPRFLRCMVEKALLGEMSHAVHCARKPFPARERACARPL